MLDCIKLAVDVTEERLPVNLWGFFCLVGWLVFSLFILGAAADQELAGTLSEEQPACSCVLLLLVSVRKAANCPACR